MKELSEQQKLLHAYEQKLAEATSATEKIKYTLFIENIKNPVEEKLESLNEENAVLSFRHTFLSNFYSVPIQYQGRTWPSVEHAYQAQKFDEEILNEVTPSQKQELNEILKERGSAYQIADMQAIWSDPNMTSGNIKVVADKLRDWGFVRTDWDDFKIELMIELLQQKFYHPDLEAQLKATGDKYLLEGNTWNDTFWGAADGRGKNFLGRILMWVRDGG